MESRTIWSQVVLDTALPGGRIAASGAPVPPAPWLTNGRIEGVYLSV